MTDKQAVKYIYKSLLKTFIASFLILSCKTEEPQNPPTVLTRAASEITTKNATLNGEVTEEGYSTVSDRGFVFSSQNSNPTINDSKIQSGVGKGIYATVLDKLEANTKYYYKAYATNNKGTSFGETQSFTSADYKLPTVVTDAPTNITYTTVELSGSVTEEGGGAVNESGFVVGINASPTTADLKFPVSKGKTSFNLVVVKLIENTKYFVRAYAINEKGIGYGNEHNLKTIEIKLPTVITDVPKNITQSTVEVSGNISDDGGGIVTQRGICFSTNSSPTISDNKIYAGEGIGSFISTIQNLKENTKYYVRAFATNLKGTNYGNEQYFNTLFAQLRDNKTLVVEVKSKTGRIWMDRNLGASRAAINPTDVMSFGDLYQWGRSYDGHQLRTSAITNVLSNTDFPGNSNFILNTSKREDWRTTRNNNLWQNDIGTNNPCPVGFRLPTSTELEEEMKTWIKNDGTGAFASPLKLPVAGERSTIDGSIVDVNTHGNYWSNSVSEAGGSRGLYFNNSQAIMFFSTPQAAVSDFLRTQGKSIRCIKDVNISQ